MKIPPATIANRKERGVAHRASRKTSHAVGRRAHRESLETKPDEHLEHQKEQQERPPVEPAGIEVQAVCSLAASGSALVVSLATRENPLGPERPAG